jgi:hypothetical protein
MQEGRVSQLVMAEWWRTAEKVAPAPDRDPPGIINVRVAELRSVGRLGGGQRTYHDLGEWLAASSEHVYCGRRVQHVPATFNSPFRNDVPGVTEMPQAAAVAAFEQRFRGKLAADPELVKELVGLVGKTLGCWCKPKACHCDVLLMLVEEYSGMLAAAEGGRSAAEGCKVCGDAASQYVQMWYDRPFPVGDYCRNSYMGTEVVNVPLCTRCVATARELDQVMWESEEAMIRDMLSPNPWPHGSVDEGPQADTRGPQDEAGDEEWNADGYDDDFAVAGAAHAPRGNRGAARGGGGGGGAGSGGMGRGVASRDRRRVDGKESVYSAKHARKRETK